MEIVDQDLVSESDNVGLDYGGGLEAVRQVCGSEKLSYTYSRTQLLSMCAPDPPTPDFPISAWLLGIVRPPPGMVSICSVYLGRLLPLLSAWVFKACMKLNCT